MLPLKVYLCNVWMKSHTPIHTKQDSLRNHALSAVGVSLTDNHHYEPKWWYSDRPHAARASYTRPKV